MLLPAQLALLALHIVVLIHSDKSKILPFVLYSISITHLPAVQPIHMSLVVDPFLVPTVKQNRYRVHTWTQDVTGSGK